MDLKKRFSEEQIIGFLQQAETGVAIKELCRQHGFSDASFVEQMMRVSSTCLVRVERNRYSVPADFAGKVVSVRLWGCKPEPQKIPSVQFQPRNKRIQVCQSASNSFQVSASKCFQLLRLN